MRLLFKYCFVLFIFKSCMGQVYENKCIIERNVFANDTLHSSYKAILDDTSYNLLGCKRLLKELDSIPDERTNIDESEKYVTYTINYCGVTHVYEARHLLYFVDNVMVFNGCIGDETFETDWWFEKDEIDITPRP